MFYNRELSWLEFCNYRVLRRLPSSSVPLFERLKFLSVFPPILMNFSASGILHILALSALKKRNARKITTESPGELIEVIHEGNNPPVGLSSAVS